MRWLTAERVYEGALAIALPFLFLHVEYQPTFTLGLGATEATVALSDLAVLVVLAVAVHAGLRLGFQPLAQGAAVWAAVALLLGLIVLEIVLPARAHAEYGWQSELVTAAKLAEYALLALVVPLLVRRAAGLVPLVVSLSAWSVAMTGVGLLQFTGVVNEFQGRRPGQREPSYVGIEDFGVLSGAALSLSFVVLAVGPRTRAARIVAWVAGVSGGIGLVLSGALAGVLGIGLAGAAAIAVGVRRRVLTPKRGVAIAASVAAVAAGVVLMRGADIERFLDFLGIRPAAQEEQRQVETYAQRTLMAYIGWRIFSDHPVLGVGFQGSKAEFGYGPYLADAHERFPDAPPRAFPSPEHPWGPHNLYLQALADMGVAGLVALLAVLASGLLLAARAAVRGPPETVPAALAAVLWLVLVIGIANGRGIVAGIPIDALLFLGLGLAVATGGWGRARA